MQLLNYDLCHVMARGHATGSWSNGPLRTSAKDKPTAVNTVGLTPLPKRSRIAARVEAGRPNRHEPTDVAAWRWIRISRSQKNQKTNPPTPNSEPTVFTYGQASYRSAK